MDENHRIPQYLAPLFDGTPLALERIKQAWPGLALSDRAYLLSVLLAERSKEPLALKWPLQRDALIDLALSDENGYIRYLAAKHVSRPDKSDDESSKARYRRVKEDKAEIVQSAEHEQSFHFFRDKPEQFWKYPQGRRLALVSGDDDGEYIAILLRYATKELLPNESVTMYEMADVLLQFLGPNFASAFAESKERAARSREPEDMYCLSQSVQALWRAVPEIAKPLSYILLGCLPDPPYSPIPPEVLESLDDGQRTHLLRRDDIALKELRTKAYLESTSKTLREASVSSWSFELQDSDISKLVLDPGDHEDVIQKKMEELEMLLAFCAGATLVQRQAICDLMTDPRYPEKVARHVDSRVSDVPEFQAARAKRLSTETLEEEVLEMRVYELAKVLNTKADKDQDRNAGNIFKGDFERLPKNLKAHLQFVTPNDSWSTYMNLRKAAPLDRWRQCKADLPRAIVGNIDLPE